MIESIFEGDSTSIKSIEKALVQKKVVKPKANLRDMKREMMKKKAGQDIDEIVVAAPKPKQE
jgi:hypothetical protein